MLRPLTKIKWTRPSDITLLLVAVALAASGLVTGKPAHAEPAKGRTPGEAAPFAEVSRRVFETERFQATVRLLDGRAFFARQHAGHLGHGGIPTHRLTVRFQPKSRTLRVPGAADLDVTLPSGHRIQTDLWQEEGQLVADLDLAATGSYGFRLGVPQQRGKRIFRWSETLR